MRSLRHRFYDGFSRWYDGFVRLHSGDQGQQSRKFLVDQLAPQPGDYLLDLCTGTGDVALRVVQACQGEGRVLGLDISRGMLRKARDKQEALGLGNVSWIQGDAARPPLRQASIRGISCSHALYELKGSHRQEALEEVARVLVPGGRFCLMEHDMPASPVPRLLLRLRSLWTGGVGEGMAVLDKVEKLRIEGRLRAPGGKSWVVVSSRIQ